MNRLLDLVSDPKALTEEWLTRTKSSLAADNVSDVEGATRTIVEALKESIETGETTDSDTWQDTRFLIEDLTRSWRDAGVPVRSTSRFFRQLGQVLILQAGDSITPESAELVNDLVDDLLLWSLEARLTRLQQIVTQQRDEMEELSTPYIELFKGIAVLPLIGTLDSERAERVTESLLVGIEKYDTRVAVLDITGVPTVDTFVAAHIVRTVEAAKLMGTHCIVSGIGPRIAMTMVRLGAGVSEVESTTRLLHAIELAFKRLGLRLIRPEA